MQKILLLPASILVLVLALPAMAAAQSNPGNSAGDQYEENVPGPGGDQPSDGNDGQSDGGDGSGDGDGDGGSSASLPPEALQELEAQGPDGEAAADLAEATGAGMGSSAGDGAAGNADGSQTDRGGDSENGDSSGGVVGASGGGGGSGLADVVQTATGTDGESGGTGLLLPIVIAASALAALAFVVARRRGNGFPGPV